MQTQIQGGKLLDSLVSMFFKGVNKILDEASTYQEEMGVLKQVTNIPVKDSEGNKFTLTVKLSPVRDKDNLFFVEAVCDDDTSNFSSIHQKTMKIDKTSVKSFNKMIKDLLDKNNLTVDDTQVEDEEESTEDTESNIDSDIEQLREEYPKLADLIEKLRRDYDSPILVKTEDDEIVELNVIIDNVANGSKDDALKLMIIIDVTDQNGDYIEKYDELEDGVLIVFNDGSEVKSQVIEKDIKDKISFYMRRNRLTLSESVKSSTSIKATLQINKKTKEVELVAINASSNITAALDIIDEIADNDEFVESLTEEPQSFEIVPEDDSYDIIEIDEVDTSGTYIELFKAIYQAKYMLEFLRWSVGNDNWCMNTNLCRCSMIEDLVNISATWVVIHEGHAPSQPCHAYVSSDVIEDITDENGQVSIDLVSETANATIEILLNELEIYIINLDQAEQPMVSGWINEIRNSLTYWNVQ